ncbi:MAG: MFS transporter [Acidobacteria bacterium]|nr:MFS transporter [Acidobacteriota bacterium]
MLAEAQKSAGRSIPLLVASAYFMENLDGTVIVSALPTMARSFHVTVADMSLGVSAYLMALAVLIPASGWFVDRYGVRRIFTLAIAGFTLASIACAASQNLHMFTLARLLQGAAGALMVPVGRLAVLRSTPKQDLIDAIATITWPGLAAPVLGPPLGGFIVEHASWHWIFLLNLPLGIAALLWARRILPPEEDAGGVFLAPPRPFDWPGFVLASTACVSVMAGMEWIGQGHNLAIGGVLLAIGVLAGVGAYVHGTRGNRPLLDPWALRLPTFATAVFSGTWFRASASSLPFLLPLLLQVGLGYNAFHSGLLVLMLFAGNLAMKPLTTPILHRFPFRTILLVNGSLTAAMFPACAFIGSGTPIALSAVILFAAGAARSMQFTAYNTIAFADVPEDRMNASNTLFNTMVQLAMGMGIALGTLALRLATSWSGHTGNPQLWDFRIALFLMGGFCLFSLVELLGLRKDAGDVVRVRESARA